MKVIFGSHPRAHVPFCSCYQVVWSQGIKVNRLIFRLEELTFFVNSGENTHFLKNGVLLKVSISFF
jgi:hypothetical protein